MSGTTPRDDDPFNATGEIDYMIAQFSGSTGWTLSGPARIIIKQAVYSIATDTLGMGDFTPRALRIGATGRALSALPAFLDHLHLTAISHGPQAGGTVIGGIFVLQHITDWADKFGCTCWPR